MHCHLEHLGLSTISNVIGKPAVLHLLFLHLQSEPYHLVYLLPHMGGRSLDCLSICSQAGAQIPAGPGQMAKPRQDTLVSDAADESPEDDSDSLKPCSSADPISRNIVPQHLASPKDHDPHSCGSPRDHSPNVCASRRGVGGLEGIARQQLRTPPRRERMPGDWSTVST